MSDSFLTGIKHGAFMAMNRKVLSIDEANARLPLVRAIVADIRPLFAELLPLKDRFAELRAHRRRRGGKSAAASYRDEIAELEADIDRLVGRFEELSDELRQADGIAADPADGVVEFHGRLEPGAENPAVWLGWTDGDDAVSYWRPLESEADVRHELVPAVTHPADDTLGD